MNLVEADADEEREIPLGLLEVSLWPAAQCFSPVIVSGCRAGSSLDADAEADRAKRMRAAAVARQNGAAQRAE
jgi:hypothetical protein